MLNNILSYLLANLLTSGLILYLPGIIQGKQQHGSYIFASIYQVISQIALVPFIRRIIAYVLYVFFYITGYFAANPGSSSCTQCTAGHYCDTTSETECGTGAYSSAGASTCTDCPPGSECPTTTESQPTECSPGTYQPSAAQDACLSCDGDYICPDYAMTTREVRII